MHKFAPGRAPNSRSPSIEGVGALALLVTFTEGAKRVHSLYTSSNTLKKYFFQPQEVNKAKHMKYVSRSFADHKLISLTFFMLNCNCT